MNIREWGHCFKVLANQGDKKHFVLICRDGGHRLCLFVIMLLEGINHQPCTELCTFLCT